MLYRVEYAVFYFTVVKFICTYTVYFDSTTELFSWFLFEVLTVTLKKAIEFYMQSVCPEAFGNVKTVKLLSMKFYDLYISLCQLRINDFMYSINLKYFIFIILPATWDRSLMKCFIAVGKADIFLFCIQERFQSFMGECDTNFVNILFNWLIV